MDLADRFFRSRWARLVVFILIAFGVTTGIRFAYNEVSFRQNSSQLNELSQRTLLRAELAADYAVLTLSELAAEGLGRCDTSSLMEIRKIIYLRGAVKDIQVLGANDVLRCAGLPQARELNVANFDLQNGYPASNGSISLHDIGLENSGLLGIVWRFGNELAFLAVLNVDSLMFDVFPAALRDQARADLLLGEDKKFASHVPLSEVQMPIMDPLEFSAKSERYPLSAEFTLSNLALHEWNREAEPYVLAFGGVLGLIIAGMSVALLSRPTDPRRELRDGIRKGEFEPYMQPIFSIDGRKIVGCEVLTRWVKADGTIVPPYQFIPLAETSGLIVPMTREIISKSLDLLADHLNANKGFKVAFNIVPADLVSETFADEICELVRAAGVERRQVILELTERDQFENLGEAIVAIKSLREHGFRVALDDTGTGHNGLSNVQALGADIIKIDKHFVDRIGVDRAATTIVQMLVRLADELGMRTVAEGIETEQQLDALRDCRVHEGQGFLVSEPVTAEKFLTLVSGPTQTARVA